MEQPRTRPTAWPPAPDFGDDDTGEGQVTRDEPDVADLAAPLVRPRSGDDGWLPGDDETREADGSDGFVPI